ncbi:MULTISPECIES: hypothetical protein [unclassified Shewanella]|uniref:hypothetical protein n=1 Tax=Shewanella TaxID=22 RepID=UPI001567E542|nr:MULTISPECIES: hypothetical protein [unclassified Shewanella]GCF88838.1 hypothetical protein SMBr_10820 [Shewanella sp. M-Br]MCU7998547.1 hypothetical protein [Shewanella sp. SM95]MCU8023548.1 hypothetical protein [Shewanella sp. SM78]MCU8041698.1 hypothetical protein [Shewanella sp. SM68]MCU8046562.1 hypothetical protein [Shewanella sp. SM65]
MNANTELPKALSVFFEQYSQEQQSRLRLTLIAELQRMRLGLEQYESSDSIEGLKHQFTGIARYLQLKDMLSVMDVCEREQFEHQLCSLLKAVMDYANEL